MSVGRTQLLFTVTALLAVGAGLFVLAATDYAWRGLLGWSLQILGIILIAVSVGVPNRHRRKAQRVGRREDS